MAQTASLHACPSHGRAVGRTQVDQRALAVSAVDASVEARNLRVGDHHVVGGRPAERDARPVQEELFALAANLGCLEQEFAELRHRYPSGGSTRSAMLIAPRRTASLAKIFSSPQKWRRPRPELHLLCCGEMRQWFASASLKAERPTVEAAVTRADIQVVQRARAMLDSPTKWNRAEKQEVPPADFPLRASQSAELPNGAARALRVLALLPVSVRKSSPGGNHEDVLSY